MDLFCVWPEVWDKRHKPNPTVWSWPAAFIAFHSLWLSNHASCHFLTVNYPIKGKKKVI